MIPDAETIRRNQLRRWRRRRIVQLVEEELDRTDDNYTPGDDEGFETPSLRWYAADVARFLTSVSEGPEVSPPGEIRRKGQA